MEISLRIKMIVSWVSYSVLFILASCGNPNGGTVLAPGHSPLLQPPASFSFSSIRSSNGVVDISWFPALRADDYKFKMGTSAGDISTDVAECSGMLFSCRITGLDPDTTYYFTLTASNAAGEKKIDADGNALSTKTFDISSAIPSDTTITLNWGSSGNATSYTVQYGIAPGNYTGTITGVTSPYTITGLTNGILYYVQVVATNANNGYTPSTTEYSARPFGPLTAPQNLSLLPTAGSMNLDWDDLAGANSYKIYRGTSPGALSEIANGVLTSNYNDASAVNGTTYYYAIRAFNGFDSAISSEVHGRSISTFNLTNATASPGPSQATITWPMGVTGAGTYDVIYGTSSGNLTSTASNVSSPYTVNALTGGLTYYFKVVARNTIGVGASQQSTNELSVVPITPIAAPTGLSASATPGSVLLNWSSVTGASNYKVLRGTSSGSLSVIAGAVGGTTYTDATAANGTTYYYAVRSFNGYDSANSAEVSIQPISNFTLSSANVLTFASAQMTWGSATGAASYDIAYGTSPGVYTGLSANRVSPATVTGLLPSTTYYVIIRARNAVGSGTVVSSNELSFTTTTEFPTVTISSAPLMNLANVSNYPVSGTCSENSRNVVVTIGSASGTTSCTAGSWSLNINASAVPDSPTLNVVASHTNSGGNSDTDTVTIVKDATKPTVAINAPTPVNIANRAAYILSGTCSDNSRTVSVNVGGVTGNPTCSSNAWSATLNLTGVSDNSAVAITADTSDAAGNAADQATSSVLKDTSAPTVSFTSTPVINNANKAAYVTSGNCSENGRSVTVTIGAVSGTGSCAGGNWSATLNVSSVADNASLAVNADHSDLAGNPATQASVNVLKDTVDPSLAITSSPIINLGNQNAYTISGTCSENGRAVDLNVGGITGSNNCSAGSWSVTLNVSSLSDGPSISVSATHTDAALNSRDASTTVQKNTALPTVAISSAPTINLSNRAAYVLSGTCSEFGRIVTVNVGGVGTTPNCNAGNWSATLNVTAVSDSGSVSVTADHDNVVGNNATQASTSVLKDTIAPTVALSSTPAITNSNKSSYTISGTCSENGRVVSVSVGGVAGSPSCTSGSWSSTLNVSSVSDSGAVTVTANHTDLAGNPATQASASVVKDTVIPTVAITVYPAINNANKASYTVSGTCSENGRTVSVLVGGIAGTPTCTTGSWSTTLNVTAAGDNSALPISADHSDAVGNTATQATRTVVKDTSNPTVAITSSPVINNANKNSYTVSGTCSDSGQNVSVMVGITAASDTCTLLTWSVTVNASGNADSATLLVTADHVDAVGNNATQAGTTVVKDTINPTVAITSSPAINNANKASYPISGTCSENGRAVTVNVGGISGTPSCSAGTWSTSLNVTSVSDGPSVAVTADHTDAALNNATQASTTVIKNTALPTVAITSYPAINNANKNAYTISGTCSENGRVVTVSVGGVGGTPTCSANAWSSTLNVSGVSDSGAVAATADHTDSVGNNANQATRSILKDTVNPTVTIASSPIINNANKSSYPISGSCSENGRAVSVNVGGVGATPTCSAGSWSASLNVSGVADSLTVSATADHTDLAGNNATQAAASVIKDTVAPTVAITSSPSIFNGNKASYTVSGTCSENGQSVNLLVAAVAGAGTCTAGAWSVTLNVSSVGDGPSISVSANHSDAAGNPATQASTTVLKDTVNPTVAVTSSSPVNNSNKTSYPVSGTCSENGRSVSLNVGGLGSSATCSTGAWSTTVDVSGVSDTASMPITADHTDLAGNSATQSSTTVLKDTVNPLVSLNAPGVINSSNQFTYPVSGTCSENTRTVSINVGGVGATTSCVAGSWSRTMNVSGVSDGGSIPITADHTDAAGNNATQATATTTKATGLPSVSITSSPAINLANRAAYTVSGTCSVNLRPVNVNVGGVTANPTCTSTSWSATLNVTGVADNASVSITADHNDGLGNNAPQASTTVLKDTVIPTVAITSSPTINNSNKGAYPVSGTCSENTRIVTVNVGGVSGTPTCTTGTWSASLNVTGVSDGGSVNITANHTDAALNPAAQASTTVLKDTVIPTVSILSAPAINNANKASYTVSGACSENGRVVTVNVGGVSGTPSCSANAWSTTLNVTSVSDNASVAVTADHSDLAGNSATQASTTVLKDTGIPTVALNALGAINNANKSSYSVSGSCSENTRVVSVNVGGVSGTPTCSSGSFTIILNLTGISDSASVSVTADHSDVAGNNATQASTTVLKDTVIPTVAINTPVAINNTNKSSYPLSGSCSENGRTVSVNVGGVSATPSCSALSWSTTLNVSGVGDNASVAITADHSDLAGNPATQATASALKDTSIPTVSISAPVAINNANKSNYSVSGSCSENGRTVSVSVGGISASPNCLTGSWSVSLNVTALADSGAVAISADHADAAGNSATQATASALKDTVNPTVAINAPAIINNANKATYSVSGTCSENGRTVSVNVGAVSGSISCSAGSFSLNLNVTSLADGGGIPITADHSDLAGNNAPQATQSTSKDTANPSVAINPPSTINQSNVSSYSVSGTCSENGRIVSVNVGGVSTTPTCTAGAWFDTLNLSGVSDSAAVAFTADHSDAAGNTATQATRTAVKDTTPPTVAISSNAAINNANKNSYPVSGTCSENAQTVSFSVGGVSGSASCSGGSWSGSVNVSGVADSGSVSILADHSDTAGNPASQASRTVLKDTVNPTVAIGSAPTINNANKSSYTVSGTCSENGRTVSVSVGGVNGSPNCTSGTWSATLNVSALADGPSISVSVSHTDLAGNSVGPVTTTVIKDATDPTVAITAPATINLANRNSYSVNGTCSENGRIVNVSVGGVTGTPTCSAGSWTVSLNVSGVADGASVSITANHADAAGNSAPQASATVLKDTVVPTVAISSAPNINFSNRNSYALNGTCSENGRTVSISVGGVPASPTCSAGAWSVSGLNVSSVGDSASVSVTANHTDAASNPATQASVTIQKDTSIPTVSITSSPVINNSNKASYTVSGNCSESGQTVSVNVGGVASSDTCTLLNWTVTVDVTSRPDSASFLITADHADTAGNSAVQAAISVVKDTALPTVAISSAPTINNANKSAYTVSGTCSESGRTVNLAIGTLNFTPTCSGTSWTSGAVNVSSLADSASLSITANHSDAAGNAATQASTTVLKDTVNPTVALNAPTIIRIANQTSYSISGTCSENGRTVNASVGGVPGSASCSGGTFSITGLNVSSVGDSATVAVNANHSDAAGNNATQASTTVLKDATAPGVTLSSTAPATFSTPSIVIRATFTEGVTGVALSQFNVSNGTKSGFTTISSTTYEITVTPVSDGFVTVNYAAGQVNDSVGNPNTAASTLTRTYVTPAVLSFATPTSYDFGTVPVGGSAEVTMLINKTGGVNATSVTGLTLSSPFSYKGGAYPGTGGSCGTTVSADCSIVLVYSPTASGTQSTSVTIQYNNGGGTTTASRSLSGTGQVISATHAYIEGPAGVTINQCIPYTVRTGNAAGQSANVGANTTFGLVVNNGSGTFYSNSGCSTTATSTTVAAGSSSSTVYFRSTTAGQTLTLVITNASFTTNTIDVTTANAPVAISYTPAPEMLTNKCLPIVVNLVDSNGAKVGKSTPVTVNLSQNGAANFFSDSVCTGTTSTLNFAAYQETKTVYVKDLSQEFVTFTFSASGLTNGVNSTTFVNNLNWWNSNYTKRIPITLNNLDQSTTHTNMPVLVKLNSGRINYADTLAGGADIRFTLSNHTTTLKYEIESWNSSGDSFIWVKIPSIAASSNMIIYMYYANPGSADGQDSTNTWSGYYGVWNMKKSGSNYIDSTNSGKDCTQVGTVSDVTGPNGNAAYLNGSAALETGTNLAPVIGANSTMSFWIKTNSTGSSQFFNSPAVTGVREDSAFNEIYYGWLNNSGFIGIAAKDSAPANSNYVINDDNWRFVTMSRQASNGAVKFYVNGILVNSGTTGVGAITTAFSRFGYRGGPSARFLTAALDGIRINNSILTDARVRGEYKFSTENNISYGVSEDY